MFSSDGWAAYCERHALSDAAREYIEEARREGPSRRVGTHAQGNVSVWHASTKMGETVPAESWTAETAFYRECEYDDSVEEFLSQPPPVRVTRTNRNGRRQRGAYTGDAIVLPIELPPYVAEVKPIATVQGHIKEGHPDWAQIGDTYYYEPARAAFADWGLEHRVVAISTKHRVRNANLAVLLRARDSPAEYDEAFCERVHELFERRAWLSLREAMRSLDLSNLTPLIQLITAGELYADIDDELIADPDTAVIARSREIIDYWRGLRDADDVQRQAASGPPPTVAQIPSESDAKKAVDNLERLRNGDESRHGRRLRERVRQGREQGLSPYHALLGRYHQSGNYGAKLPKSVRNYLQEFLDHDWSSAKRLSKRKAYRLYCKQARERHPKYSPAGWTKFRTSIMEADSERVAYGRGGRRAAGAERAPSPAGERAVRAILPFQIATADHYQIDVYVVLYRVGEKLYTVRLWLTVLKDLFSGQVLGRFLSVAHPSRVSCAMVLRDCVRRHKRLPAMIMVDRGKEFVSVYFRSLLADVGVDLGLRPAEKPKYGSEAERLFGEFKNEWLSYVDGNSVQWFEGRAVSTTHKPQNTAALNPADFLEQLDNFMDWRENALHGAALQTPQQAEDDMAGLYPFVGVQQDLDHEFLIKSAVDVREYTVDPRRGIHTGDDLHFWAPELRSVRSKNQVEVRMDPECPYQIYARVGDQWVTCEATRNARYWRQRRLDREAEAMKRYGAGSLREDAKRDAQEELVELQTAVPESAAPLTDHKPREAMSTGEPQPAPSLFDQVRDAPVDDIGEDS